MRHRRAGLSKPALAAAVIAFVVSVASWPLHLYGFDATAVREEARAMILHRRLAILQPPDRPLEEPGAYFVQNPRNGEWYSKYGVFGAVASLPPMVVEYAATGQLGPIDSRDRPYLLNLYNTLLTTALAWLLVRVAALYSTRGWVQAGFAISTLFCTFLWNYTRAQSSEIVQVLLAVVAFDQLVRWQRAGKGWRLAIVWACVAALVLTRIYFAVLLPVVMWAIFQTGSRPRATEGDAGAPPAPGPQGQDEPPPFPTFTPVRRLACTIAPPLAILILLALINTAKFGSPTATGYHAWQPARHALTLNPLSGLWGFLVSAQKGIWWHFPLLLPALLGWPRFWREHRRDAALLIAAALLYTLPLCTVPSWAGEWSYGPRYLLFGLPLMALPAVLWAERARSRLALGSLAALLLLSGSFNFQVNRLEWFTANDVRESFRALAPPNPSPSTWPEDDPFPGRAYFDRRPWFLIVSDLLWHGGRLERMQLGTTARAVMTPDRFEIFRAEVWRAHQYGNLYWETAGKRFDESKFKLPDDW